ncbi:MAG: phosphatidate cytidylyltransferase [Anaerolineales bacterium]|nr:phosphatidate cytidylyltransferase [Anaerolineales bacterium]
MLSLYVIPVLVTFLVAVSWLRLNDFVAHRGWISSHLSRKFIHMGTGPLFVICWLLFSDGVVSRYLAALVPLAITLQFILVGSGVIRDEAAVKAMSRTGDRREILRGPLIYGIVFVLLTIIYWKDTPIGVVTLMLMCGGDGLADILGRKFGGKRLPWNPGKSWVGSLGMFSGGFIFAAGILAVYLLNGYFTTPWISYLPNLALIALAGTLVESLPIKDIDNLSVTLTAVLLGHILW